MVELVPTRRAFVPRVRDQLSADLVHAMGEVDVRRVVGEAVQRITGLDVSWVLRPCLEGTHLHVHCTLQSSPVAAGVDAELSLAAVAEPWTRAMAGEVASGRHEALPEVAEQILWVPMGAEHDRWVLAVPIDPTKDGQTLRADLRAVADEAWAALQRAEIITDLEGQLEILSAITAVAGSAVVDVRVAAERVCRVSLTSLGASVAVLHAIDQDGVLRHLAGAGGETSHGPGSAAARQALRDGREVVPFPVSDGALPTGPWNDGPVGELVGLPLRVADRVVGSLLIARRPTDRPWEPLTLQVAAAIAQQAALAIDHAQLLEREQQATESLRHLDELKSDWLAGLTHDLKAPLTGLVGFTRTMLTHDERITAEDRRQYLQAMDRQASRLVAMVDDLLLAARMEDDDVDTTDSDAFCLRDILVEASETFGPTTRARMQVEVDPTDRFDVRGDRSQLLRLVTNLLDNACKYSGPSKPVVARLTLSGLDAVVLVVDDHGPGIPENEREIVFDRFGRGAQGEQKKSTGLGLYIGRGIARGHGGELEVESAPTGGARLRLRLPLAVAG